jgi:hypothetical protein
MRERSSFLRVRLYLNSKQPCYRHLEGKTEQEIRAWAEMALNYVGALLDAGTGELEGTPRIMSAAIKQSKRPIQSSTVDGGETAAAVPFTKLTKKLPGTGNFLQNARAGWGN